jgi:hypothetical protein
MRSFDSVRFSFVETNSAQDDRWLKYLSPKSWFRSFIFNYFQESLDFWKFPPYIESEVIGTKCLYE